MFENQFRNIAKFSIKNRKKIIIFWIALFLIMSPFAIKFINNTNFDFANGLVPKQSQSYNANLTYSEQFGRTGSVDPTMVIVTTGTSVNSQSDISQLLSLQNNLTNYFSSGSYGFLGLHSILTVESSILSGLTSNLSLQLIGTKSLIQNVNSAVYGFIPVANNTANFFLGIPLVYLDQFLFNYSSQGKYVSSNNAYNSTSAYISTNLPSSGIYTKALGSDYLENFSKEWNATLLNANLTNGLSLMGLAVNSTVLNSNFSRSLFNLSNSAWALSVAVDSNITLQQFSNKTIYPLALDNFSVGVISSNVTVAAGLQQLNLLITPYSFVYDSFNLSDHIIGDVLVNYTATTMVLNSLTATLASNPTIHINYSQAVLYLNYLQNNSAIKISQLVYMEMTGSSHGFQTYPFVPRGYYYHQLVGYDNSTTIFEASFSESFGLGLVNAVTSIADNYNSPSRMPGSSYYVAGSSASASEYQQQSTSGLVAALAIGIILSVFIVGIFFRSPLSALIPLTVFIISAVISMGLGYIVYDVFFHSEVSFITPTLLLILLLGITSDYVVYIMSRYRRELRVKSEEPLENAGQWAGHAVFTSGITVAASYLILWLANVPLFSDAGITNAIGVTVTIFLANTFLIAILYILKDRIFWPAKISNMKHAPFERPMRRVANIVTSHKFQFMAILVVVTLVGVFIYLDTPAGLDIFALLPANSSTQALQAVNSSFNGDLFEQNYIVVQMPSPIYQNNGGNITYNATEMKDIAQLENLSLQQPQISEVFGPSHPFGYFQNWDLSNISGIDTNNYHNPYTAQILSYFGNNSSYAIIYYQTSALAYSPWVTGSMSHFDQEINNLSIAGDYQFYNGGLSQGLADANAYSHAAFAEIIPIIVITVAVILFIQLSSLLTPLRLIAMVLAMVVFSLALTYVYFYYIQSLPIIIFLPMFVFVTLLAVGLDYDIFMITRVREEVIKGASTNDAIRVSVSENGGIIIALGSILFVTFFALNFANFSILSEIGTGLALGIVLDTFVSWPFFVPAIMTIMEKYNWWPSSIYAKKPDK